jgi:uncharacterized protein YdhG (YjbR/CyaY superfamily)
VQYDVKTPREYIAILKPDWRKDVIQYLRLQISQFGGPELTETIRYKMLCYEGRQTMVMALNAQMHFVALYVGNAKKIDTDGSLLKGFDVGKGCIRIKKSTAIPCKEIEKFINKTIEMWKRGDDIGCENI